jgi:hypothetical protein
MPVVKSAAGILMAILRPIAGQRVRVLVREKCV